MFLNVPHPREYILGLDESTRLEQPPITDEWSKKRPKSRRSFRPNRWVSISKLRFSHGPNSFQNAYIRSRKLLRCVSEAPSSSVCCWFGCIYASISATDQRLLIQRPTKIPKIIKHRISGFSQQTLGLDESTLLDLAITED